MTTDARAILTAATHVLDSWERGEFRPDTDCDISSIEWDDGYAAREDDGRIWVEIPNGTRVIHFWVCPETAEITRAADYA